VTGDADIVRHVLGDAYKQFAYGPAESTRRRVEAYEAFDRLVADIERLTAERDRVHRVLDNAGVPKAATESSRVGVLWGDREAAEARAAQLEADLAAAEKRAL
jgi:hypothetical protein